MLFLARDSGGAVEGKPGPAFKAGRRRSIRHPCTYENRRTNYDSDCVVTYCRDHFVWNDAAIHCHNDQQKLMSKILCLTLFAGLVYAANREPTQVLFESRKVPNTIWIGNPNERSILLNPEPPPIRYGAWVDNDGALRPGNRRFIQYNK